ncbi:MAG: nuclear transport factor 2 family protein [Actinobacteria bacterium]|nr:nuclear transport factor 2 family protein [Actinomycetota bacterium]
MTGRVPADAYIIELEHELIRAVQARDMGALERLLGDGFTLTTGRPGKEVRSRDEWMRVTEHRYEIDHYEFEELTVQAFEGCAIVRSRYRQQARMGDLARNTVFRMTDVWVRMSDGWKLQARHAQPVEGD